MATERERREVEAGGPSFGPLDEIGQVSRGQLDAGHRLDQGGRLRAGEAQLAHPDLDHVADGPQPGERQPRVRPGDEHHQDGRRKMQQQGRQLLVAAGFPDDMEVVQHQDDWLGETGQPGDQFRDHRVGDVRGPGPERPLDVLAGELWAGSFQGGDDMPPQPAGIVITRVERQPGEPAALDRAGPPLGHEGGLAEARGRVDQDELGRRRVGQPAQQPGSRDPLGPHAGRVQLGFDGQVEVVIQQRGPGDGAQSAFRGALPHCTRICGHQLTVHDEARAGQGRKSS